MGALIHAPKCSYRFKFNPVVTLKRFSVKFVPDRFRLGDLPHEIQLSNFSYVLAVTEVRVIQEVPLPRNRASRALLIKMRTYLNPIFFYQNWLK